MEPEGTSDTMTMEPEINATWNTTTVPPFVNGDVRTTLADSVTELTAFAEYRSAVVIRVLGTIFIAVLASIGNPLSLAVLRSVRLKHSTTSILLSYLAVVDLLCVYFALVPQTISYATGHFVQLASDFGCRFFWFAPLFLTELSSWVLVLVSVERVIAVWLPTKLKTLSTTRTAAGSLAVVTIVLFAVNTRYFFTKKLIGDSCVPNPPFADFEKFGSVWLDRMLYWGVPMIAMLVSNIVIFAKIRLLRSNGQQQTAGRFKNKTIIMMTNTFAFMVCTTPLMFFNIIYEGWDNNPKEIKVKYELAYSVLQFFAYLNHAINFILYCAAGSRFREEFQYVVMRKSRAVWPEATSTVSMPRRARLESRMEVGFRLDTGFGS
ncbi:probable G-protein coupled receptor 139 [Lineus longissimus]|uniref:probable G-protein coupled receptor 139 n=1 Tax=Lineus longissimus TaxID=88925 RepID=UPI00315DC24D